MGAGPKKEFAQLLGKFDYLVPMGAEAPEAERLPIDEPVEEPLPDEEPIEAEAE